MDRFHPEKSMALREAARHGDLRALERALGAPADPNEVDGHGWTPMISAAHAGHGGALRLLARARAELELATPHGRTPLFVASQRGNVEAARVLGPSRSRLKTFAETPLKCVVEHPSEVLFEVLCELSADTERARRASEKRREVLNGANRTGGYTPLLAASREGHRQVVQLLCEKGADKERAAHGWTASLLAARQGHAEVVKARWSVLLALEMAYHTSSPYIYIELKL